MGDIREVKQTLEHKQHLLNNIKTTGLVSRSIMTEAQLLYPELLTTLNCSLEEFATFPVPTGVRKISTYMEGNIEKDRDEYRRLAHAIEDQLLDMNTSGTIHTLTRKIVSCRESLLSKYPQGVKNILEDNGKFVKQPDGKVVRAGAVVINDVGDTYSVTGTVVGYPGPGDDDSFSKAIRVISATLTDVPLHQLSTSSITIKELVMFITTSDHYRKVISSWNRDLDDVIAKFTRVTVNDRDGYVGGAYVSEECVRDFIRVQEMEAHLEGMSSAMDYLSVAAHHAVK